MLRKRLATGLVAAALSVAGLIAPATASASASTAPHVPGAVSAITVIPDTVIYHHSFVVSTSDNAAAFNGYIEVGSQAILHGSVYYIQIYGTLISHRTCCNATLYVDYTNKGGDFQKQIGSTKSTEHIDWSEDFAARPTNVRVQVCTNYNGYRCASHS